MRCNTIWSDVEYERNEEKWTHNLRQSINKLVWIFFRAQTTCSDSYINGFHSTVEDISFSLSIYPLLSPLYRPLPKDPFPFIAFAVFLCQRYECVNAYKIIMQPSNLYEKFTTHIIPAYVWCVEANVLAFLPTV